MLPPLVNCKKLRKLEYMFLCSDFLHTIICQTSVWFQVTWQLLLYIQSTVWCKIGQYSERSIDILYYSSSPYCRYASLFSIGRLGPFLSALFFSFFIYPISCLWGRVPIYNGHYRHQFDKNHVSCRALSLPLAPWVRHWACLPVT